MIYHYCIATLVPRPSDPSGYHESLVPRVQHRLPRSISRTDSAETPVSKEIVETPNQAIYLHKHKAGKQKKTNCEREKKGTESHRKEE
jgi:hypothetical protein